MAENRMTGRDELRGALFINNKGDNPNRPDRRGRCLIDGKAYRISGWIRTGQQSGQQYLSLSYTRDETLDPSEPTEPTEDAQQSAGDTAADPQTF